MDEKEMKIIEDSLKKIKAGREIALSKSQKELEKVDKRRDPKTYAEIEKEIEARKNEIKSVDEYIQKYTKISERISEINMQDLLNEQKEKREKLEKAEKELEEIDKRKDPKTYAEGENEVLVRKEELDKIDKKVTIANKELDEIKKQLEEIMEKYHIKKPKKDRDTDSQDNEQKQQQDKKQHEQDKNSNDEEKKSEEQDYKNPELDQLRSQLESKRSELQALRKNIMANNGEINVEQRDKILELKDDIKKLKQQISDIENNRGETNDQTIDENKQQEQQLRIEDKRDSQPRIEYKPEEVPENKLPIERPNMQPSISFFEVVAKTDTVHIGNMEGKLHSLAHSPIFRTGIIEAIKKGDPVGALTGFIPKTAGSIMMLGPKLASKVFCAVKGTNKKFKELQDNIDKLSPEEFEILTGDNSPSDYSLNPTTMSQFKFNDKYLQAINGRVQRERRQEKKMYADWSNKLNAQIEAIKSELATGKYSQADASILTKQLTDLGRQKNTLESEAQKAESKRLAFEDGMELKSSRKKNIPGWIAAVRNPNNIKCHEQMAEYSRERREARLTGDYTKEFEMDEKLDQYINDQTSMKMMHISRGLYQKAGIEFENSRESQTKGREILSSAAIVSSILAVAKAIEIDKAKAQNQQDLNNQIDQHNQDINSHNVDVAAQNQSIQGVKGHQISDNTINGAVKYQRHTDAANIRAEGELEGLNTIGAQHGSWSVMNQVNNPIDNAIHQAQAHKIGDVPMGSSTQSYINEFNQSVDNMTAAMKSGRLAEQAYQNSGGHANFDVTQFMDSTNNSVNFSSVFKQFFADALKQNDAIANLAQTPVTMASTMGNFTINIPSAIAPTFVALAASFANSYRESEENARKIISAQRKKEKNEELNKIVEKDIKKRENQKKDIDDYNR